MLYAQLLRKYQQIMGNRTIRKELTIFCKLAKEIKTRTAKQIKTHHQKMIRKYKTIDGIVRAAEEKWLMEVKNCSQPLSRESSPEIGENEEGAKAF